MLYKYYVSIWILLLLLITNFHAIVMGKSAKNLTDLSWELNALSLPYSGSTHFMHTKKTVGATSDGSWIAFNEFRTSELCGTYLNAPYHLYKYGWKVHQIPLSHLILPCLVIDISTEVSCTGPDSKLTQSHLEKWQRSHSPLPEKFILLIRFGWAQYYHIPKYYIGPNPKEPHYPGLSISASKWIVDCGKIVGVGVDIATIRPGVISKNSSSHRILAESQIYCILNLNLINKIPAKGITLIVMPLKITDGTGSPVRVVAIRSNDRYDAMLGLQTVEYDAMVKWYGELIFGVCCFTILLLLICHGLNEFVVI